MKLWALHYHLDDTPSGNCTDWFTSKRAAETRLRELKRENPDGANSFFPYDTVYPNGIQQVNVPTTKAALAAWLTEYQP